MITGVQDFYYNVSDMKRATEFYSTLLGKKPSYSTDHFTVFDVGGLRFAIHWAEGDSIPKIGRDSHGAFAGGTITFASDDIPSDRKRLEQLGCKILGEADQPWGHMLVFEDADGNVLKLMKAKR
jgi:predicted enzyme related to lactoylglutathione lyase